MRQDSRWIRKSSTCRQRGLGASCEGQQRREMSQAPRRRQHAFDEPRGRRSPVRMPSDACVWTRCDSHSPEAFHATFLAVLHAHAHGARREMPATGGGVVGQPDLNTSYSPSRSLARHNTLRAAILRSCLPQINRVRHSHGAVNEPRCPRDCRTVLGEGDIEPVLNPIATRGRLGGARDSSCARSRIPRLRNTRMREVKGVAVASLSPAGS